MVAGFKVANRRPWQNKNKGGSDGGVVEGRIQENVTEKQQWRYVMVACLKVAYKRT